jgi:hypothetical protein
MKKIEKEMNIRLKISLSESHILYGNEQILSDAIRGIYFYNMGYLTKEKKI